MIDCCIDFFIVRIISSMNHLFHQSHRCIREFRVSYNNDLNNKIMQ